MYKNKIITINNSTKIIKLQIKDELITIQIFLSKLQNEDFQEELKNAIKNT
jgi:formiminotetrahydrofolate cyclodeaminase